MAWIESHTELSEHPKTRRLARLLGESIPAAIGRLHLLWWWATKYAIDGDLSRYEPEDIADALMWDGDPHKLVSALIQAGFIDEPMYIHDWDDYAGRLLEQRQLQADRKKRSRQLYDDINLTRTVKQRDGDKCRYCGVTVNWRDRKGPQGGTYDHVDPDGPNTPENIVVACRSCNSKKGRRKPEDAGLTLLPSGKLQADQSTSFLPVNNQKSAIPNQTVPNQTLPNHTLPNLTAHTTEISGDPLLGERNPERSKKEDERASVANIEEIFSEYELATGESPDKMQLQRLIDQYGAAKVREKIAVIATFDELRRPFGALKKALEEDWKAAEPKPRAQPRADPAATDERYKAFYDLFP
ncbi:MAG: HNH endonuclease, partial [Alicyclobacillus sp.]|nr:HNH endonuclease [Alicyclobacillus sp.]